MLALARLQRKIRLVESPYKTPQTLVGGPRVDAALLASSGRTATTKAMGKGSTQHQHLIQTEVPKKLLEEWLAMWSRALPARRTSWASKLRPHRAGSELLELAIGGDGNDRFANVVFAPIQDRRGRNILSVRDQNTFDGVAAQEAADDARPPLAGAPLQEPTRCTTSRPTEDNQYQTAKMKSHGLFSEVQHRGRPDHRRRRQPAAASRSCSRPTAWRWGS